MREGDIVRRQYFDNQLKKNADGSYSGKDVGMIYSLMCVLETGVDYSVLKDKDGNDVFDDNGNVVEQKQPWFIGALLEGSAPKTDELLDFVRTTSLYDTDRSGALYLTASDDQAPFMDIIDGIGRNESLCWPEDICRSSTPDHETQYVLEGALSADYNAYDGQGHDRVVHIRKTAGPAGFTGLSQEFYKYVSNPNMVLVSYKAKASKAVRANVALKYINDSQTDGDLDVVYDTDWKYYFHAITVDWSGRHLRKVQVDLGTLGTGDEVWISDFNIILLSSVANFKDASKVRIGKLAGVVDPVFGRLDGYGGYLQKLFASQSAHISGTLTAGDENGFGSSFYAGKIHKNVFVNSLEPNITGAAIIDGSDDIINPTGVGNIYKSSSDFSVTAQSNDWLTADGSDGTKARIGKPYTYSFWVYSKKPCVVDLFQNGVSLGALYINVLQTHQWVRLHKTFELNSPPASSPKDNMVLSVTPVFKSVTDGVFGSDFKDNQFSDPNDKADDTLLQDVDIIYFTAPQLESGSLVTQYQPTDEKLNYIEDYGAWFDRGGIGGTIQNPLLKLNADGKGAIASRTDSFRLNQDGSGHIANGNISWEQEGDVHLKNITFYWDDLSSDCKDKLSGKSIHIIGQDTFTLYGDESGQEPVFSPEQISLELEVNNIPDGQYALQWYYIQGEKEVAIDGATERIFTITPNDGIWSDVGSTVTLKCTLIYKQQSFSDSITIKKRFITGYTVEITSKQGQVFKNGICSTVLTANVFYQGKLVSPDFISENFVLVWKKYSLPDTDTPVEGWWKEIRDDNGNIVQEEIDRTQQEITVSYPIFGRDLYICELQHKDGFPYVFPSIF